MKIQFNKLYEFDLAGKVKFGDMPEEAIYELYKDGRVAVNSWSTRYQLGFQKLNSLTKTDMIISIKKVLSMILRALLKVVLVTHLVICLVLVVKSMLTKCMLMLEPSIIYFQISQNFRKFE